MSLPTRRQVWILANPPSGPIQPDTFRLEEAALPEVKDGEVLIQVDYLSNDPAQRGMIQAGADPKRAYRPPLTAGQPMGGTAVGKVLASKSQKYAAGDVVTGRFGWTDYDVIPDSQIDGRAVELPGKPYASLSPLGMTSVTAYQGIFDILNVKPEHVVVISGAAGAVGSVAVQLAKKVVGAKRVVGIAGGKEKCDWVVSLGADACVDYKSPTFGADLKTALQDDDVDRYFDNVGGVVFDTLLTVMRTKSKIGVCGQISSYNGVVTPFPRFGEVIKNRLTIEGFLVLDFLKEWPAAVADLAKWVKEGKLSTTESETVVDASLADVPEVWQRLFKGENRGKLVTKIAH